MSLKLIIFRTQSCPVIIFANTQPIGQLLSMRCRYHVLFCCFMQYAVFPSLLVWPSQALTTQHDKGPTETPVALQLVQNNTIMLIRSNSVIDYCNMPLVLKIAQPVTFLMPEYLMHHLDRQLQHAYRIYRLHALVAHQRQRCNAKWRYGMHQWCLLVDLRHFHCFHPAGGYNFLIKIPNWTACALMSRYTTHTQPQLWDTVD